MVAEVVTDDLRVRTSPGVSDSSVMLEPLLGRGTMLYVVEGPVEATGYGWYRVQLFGRALTEPGDDVDQQEIEQGWVAGADKNGEVWVDVADPPCPPAPASLDDLVDDTGMQAIDGVTAVACFGGVPISFEARVFDCRESPALEGVPACEMDTGSPSFQPDWFDRTLRFLAPVEGDLEERSLHEMHADPDGSYPEPMVFGEPVLVTGQFNHPAASDCTVYHYFQDDQPTAYCRTVFAVTRIEALAS
jgi:hypothetical protein